MSTVTLDDGVQNLSQFCNLLAQTNESLHAHAEGFDALSGQLQELEDSAEEHIGGLGDQLQDFATETDQGAEEAVGDLEELAEAAQQADQSELDEIEQDTDSLEQKLTERLDRDREEIDQHAETLNQDGFDVLDAGLSTALETMGRAEADADEAFGNLITALGSQQQQIVENAAEQSLQEAAAVVTSEMEALDGAAEEATHAWLDEMPSEVVSECAGVVEPLQSTYDGFRQSAEDDGQDLIDTVSTLAEETARLLGVELTSDLEQAWEGTLTPALGEWEDGLGDLETTLGDGEETVQDLDPLVDELVIARDTVAEIDRVLDNME